MSPMDRAWRSWDAPVDEWLPAMHASVHELVGVGVGGVVDGGLVVVEGCAVVLVAAAGDG